jgi:hypothetical protein
VLDTPTIEACFDDTAHLGYVPASIERLSRLERPAAR